MRLLCVLVLLASLPALCRGDEGGAPAAEGAAASSGESALFGDMPVVEAAALHSQTLAEAPASVTVITAADIRKFGYRTLGDVLASARGFTVTNSHLVLSSGVRGFAVPGDINTCFLVMINGHAMTETIGDSNSFFDQDFGLDLDIVNRIEIIRGPSSALYGTNGILATINIITKSPVDSPAVMVSTETAIGGVQKAVLMSSQNLGKGANLLVEGSGFLTGGHDLAAPGFGMPGQSAGIANHVDGQNGYHSFANLQWGSWSFFGYANTHLQDAPILGRGTVFNDPSQFVRSARDFAGADYTHDFAGGGQVRWQFYYDDFRYSDRYDYLIPGGVLDNRDEARGNWISSQLSYSHAVPRIGLLTVGLSGRIDLRNEVINEDHSPEQRVNLSISHPDRTLAPFVQQEWNFAQNWKAFLGARFDDSHNYGSFLSPRLALVYQPTARSSYKVVYGRPFRSPSVYEQYYQDGISQAANLHLRPETAEAVEVSAERMIGKSGYAMINAYQYSLGSVIEEVWISDSLSQYQNSVSRNSRGIEFEIGGHPLPGIETTASLSLDRAVDAKEHLTLANAPARIAKVRAAIPMLRDRICASTDFQYLSARLTTSGEWTRPVAFLNATVSSTRLFRGLDFVAGIRNALNWRYHDPIAWSIDATVDQIQANGRTAFVKLIWRQGD